MTIRRLTPKQIDLLLDDLPDDDDDQEADGVMDDEDAVAACVFRGLSAMIETLDDQQINAFLDAALVPKARH